MAANPKVTVVWAPPERHGYTLILDGLGVVDGDNIRVTPDHAVLHRPGAHADGPAAPEIDPA